MADAPKKTQPGWISAIRSNFLTGVVIVAPIGLTVWLIWTVTGWIDNIVLPLVPDAYQPDRLVQQWWGRETQNVINVRGIGVIVFLLFTIVIGWMGKGFFGRSLIRWAEGLVDRMPVVRSIYNGVKQIAETVLAQSDTSFDRACLIEYPRKGIWAIGLISTSTKGEVAEKGGNGEDMISIFVPTTPNPTSGFLLFFPVSDVKELDMSVEDAIKLVISGGLVYPSDKIEIAEK